MNKYENIFWHQGIRQVNKPNQAKAEHLENDVTKSLLNLFQYTNRIILKEFLKLIRVNNPPESFKFDFQIFGKQNYRLKSKRIMLSIISEFTKKVNDKNYNKKYSIPDACIFSPSTAILIESKTQSPLVTEQIENHVKEFLGDATRVTITWEQLYERFKQLIPKLKNQDRFLTTQFCEYLDIIGLSKFSGFNESDFSSLAMIQSMSPGDYLDFKRIMTKKVERFVSLLFENVKSDLDFKPCGYKVGKVSGMSPDLWCAIYFFNSDPNEHVNNYPNLNFIFYDSFIDFSINAEIEKSQRIVVNKLKKYPDTFAQLKSKLDETIIVLYYKFQYRPQNFIWHILPGFPYKLNEISANFILSSIKKINEDWEDIKNTLLYELQSGISKHHSGQMYSEKEILFAKHNNKTPNVVIRIGKTIAKEEVVASKKKIIQIAKRNIKNKKELIKFLVSK